MIASDFHAAQLVVARHFRRAADDIGPDTRFVEDLGADSLDMVELAHALEEELDVTLPDADAAELRTVADVVTFAARARS